MFNHLLPHQFMSYWKLRYKLGDYLSYWNVSGTIESIKRYKWGALISVKMEGMEQMQN